jgi:hypothetical protein
MAFNPGKRDLAVRGREVAAGKDVGGREGGGGAHTVGEEDLVRGRDEDYA